MRRRALDTQSRRHPDRSVTRRDTARHALGRHAGGYPDGIRCHAEDRQPPHGEPPRVRRPARSWSRRSPGSCRLSRCVPPHSKGPADAISFFQGQPQSMRMVSTYSLQEAWRGQPRILEFQVIPGEEGRGVRLMVNEYPYTGPLAAGQSCVGMMVDPNSGLQRSAIPPDSSGSAVIRTGRQAGVVPLLVFSAGQAAR